MPSTKDPNTVVQVGPGLLPAGVVPASALLFEPGSGAELATQVAYAGGPEWVDLDPNPGTNVGAQLTKIIGDLTNDQGSVSDHHAGSDRLSARQTVATFADSATVNGTSIQAIVEALVTALAATTLNHAGSDKVAARTTVATFADTDTATGASIQALVEAVITQLASTASSHAGSDKVAARTTVATFADTDTATGASIQALVEAVITQLAGTTLNHAGSDKVGARDTTAVFADGGFASGNTVQSLIEDIIVLLASSSPGSSGANRLGAEAVSNTAPQFSLTAGELASQLTSLVGLTSNQRVYFTCGDGTLSFGDFNGANAINQAITYWQGLSPVPLTAVIYVKHGNYQQSASFTVSGAGHDLKIIGEGRSSTSITGPAGVSWALVSSGCQVSFQDVTLINGTATFLNYQGSVRGLRCYFSGVIQLFASVGTPLQEGAITPYFAIFDDCEFNSGSVFQWSQGTGSGFLWRNCTFAGAQVPYFQFTGASTASVWRHIVCEHCNFQVNGIPSASATALVYDGGIMGVSTNGHDLTMLLDEVVFEDCHVSSTDVSSDSVVLLHLFPLTNGTSSSRVQIGQVTIRGGIWSLPQSRGNDFCPFFLMCSNPVVEDLTIVGGGTPWSGFETSPGFQGNGDYTDAMRYALTGTNGWATGSGFFATIAASGAGLFYSAGSSLGSIAFSSPTVTFTDGGTGQFALGMVGMMITITGSSHPGNNGTFVITAYVSTTEVQFTNASGVADSSGTITWSITSTLKSGMVVRNLEVQNVVPQSFSGDLCLVGSQANGGPVDVDGVLVTNLGGVSSGNTNLPLTRIYLRPGTAYSVTSNVASVVSGTNGTNGVFRDVSWTPINVLASIYSFVNTTGISGVVTGAICLGYTGDLHVEDVKILPQNNTIGGVPGSALTCTELWGTTMTASQRGHLRLRNALAENWGVSSGSYATITLTDFNTIEGDSLEVYETGLSSVGTLVGIKVIPQYTLTGGTGASITLSTGIVTVTGLTGMTQADVGGTLLIQGAAAGGNNGSWLISTVNSSSSVVIVNVSGSTDGHNGSITWGLGNNLVSKWTLSDCKVEFDNVLSGTPNYIGIESLWTIGTAQGWQGATTVTHGDVRGCYVNVTTSSVSFTGSILQYIFGANDLLTGGGQVPSITCFSNVAQQAASVGVEPGTIETYYFVGSTKTAIPNGVSNTQGFATAFNGDLVTGDSMVFNNAFLQTP